MTPKLVPPVTDQDHIIGSSDAPITLLEYGDFECPYCGAAYPIVESIRQRLAGDLRFVFRNFPLREQHPHAEHAAEGAEAAGAQGKFWEMHHALFEHQDSLDDDDLVRYASMLQIDPTRFARELTTGAYAARVGQEFSSGVRSGVNGTPTFFINGQRYDGPWNDAAAFGSALLQASNARSGASIGTGR